MSPLKVLHISDLHFAADEIIEPLTELKRAFETTLPTRLDIHVADKLVLRALGDLVHAEDPDVVILTGDVTTFGDPKSFEAAQQWLSPLLQRSEARLRRLVVVPGNHDVLRWHLGVGIWHEVAKAPFYLQAALKLRLRRIHAALRQLIKKTGSPPDSAKEGLLADFRTFASAVGAVSDAALVLNNEAPRVEVFPFSSVSANPIWMNLGSTPDQELSDLQRLLRDSQQRNDTVRIVALHHNPVSSAAVVENEFSNAYNSMPAGVQLLRTLQESGVDLVLHGHQHESALLRYDLCDSGTENVYLIGSRSSSAREGGGCNLITIRDANHAELTRYEHTAARGAFTRVEQKAMALNMERERPTDSTTRSVRQEIKRYLVRHDSSAWDDLQAPGCDLVYMSGRTMGQPREDKFRYIHGMLLSGTRIRLLLNNPSLLRTISTHLVEINDENLRWDGATKTDLPQPRSTLIWGREEELSTLADQTLQTLDDLKAFIAELSPDHRRKIDVRLSHTIVPFGATIRNPGHPNSKMAVRLLPQGGVGELLPPMMVLSRRVDQALFDYHLKHLRLLLFYGLPVLGEWDLGDADLKIQGLSTSST